MSDLNQGSSSLSFSSGSSLSDPPEGVEIWFQLDTPDCNADCLNFSGESVVSLRRAIKDAMPDSLRDYDAPQLNLFIVYPETGVEINLFDLEKKNTRAFNLNRLINDYKVGINNPIIVKPPAIPGYCSESYVLDLVPPKVKYVHRRDISPSTATTKSVFRRTPKTVVHWDDFLNKVESYTPSTDPIYEKRHFDFGPRRRIVANESDLASALDSNVFDRLNILANPGESFGSHSSLAMKAQPDRIFYRDPEQLLDSQQSLDLQLSFDPEQLLLAIEVKIFHVLPMTGNLVRKFKEDIQDSNQDFVTMNSVPYLVQQIFGYLSCNRLQYGVLTSYEQTWFLKRDQGTLYVSPPVTYFNTNPTLYRCYRCMMELAGQDRFNPSAPPSPILPPTLPLPDDPPNGGDNPSNGDDDPNDGYYDPESGNHSGNRRNRGKQGDDNSSRKKRGHVSQGDKQSCKRVITRQLSTGFSITIGEVYLSKFEFGDFLGEGRSGEVFRAKWQGETVAVKICDLYQHPDYEEEVLTEVAVYDALKPLQGFCIPHLKLAGYDGGIFVIAMEIAGFGLEVHKLSYPERLEILNKLSSIHKLGILHGDIRASNILIRHDNGMKAYFIDFGMAKSTRNKVELQRERLELKKLLGLAIRKTLTL